jgi:hypothetical protein
MRFDGEKPQSVGHHRSSLSVVRGGVLGVGCSMSMAAVATVRRDLTEPWLLSKSSKSEVGFLLNADPVTFHCLFEPVHVYTTRPVLHAFRRVSASCVLSG